MSDIHPKRTIMNWRSFARIFLALALLKLSTGCDTFDPERGMYGAFGCYFVVKPGGGCTLVRTKKERHIPYDLSPRESVAQTTVMVPDAPPQPKPEVHPETKTESNPFASSDGVGMAGGSQIVARSMMEGNDKPAASSSGGEHSSHSD